MKLRFAGAGNSLWAVQAPIPGMPRTLPPRLKIRITRIAMSVISL
jgi:hypothetical protein